MTFCIEDTTSYTEDARAHMSTETIFIEVTRACADSVTVHIDDVTAHIVHVEYA